MGKGMRNMDNILNNDFKQEYRYVIYVKRSEFEKANSCIQQVR